MSKTAFHAIWTARDRRTQKILIDHALASGPEYSDDYYSDTWVNERLAPCRVVP